MTSPRLDLSSRVIAHRGASHYAPENTLAALQKAYELHIPWIEFDVMLTEDNVPIIIHDETLERTTDGHGEVAKTAYKDIAALDAGSWFDRAFSGEHIPTFAEFLKQAAELNLSVNVEIKPSEGKDQETAMAVVQTLQAHWLTARPNLLVSSFSVVSLTAARALDKSLCLGLLLDHWFGDWQESLLQLDCVALHANWRILTKRKVAQIKDLGRYVLAYTVDNPEQARELFSWGVDAVFSNVPDVILSSVL